jgi:hypothetical protein
MKFSLPASGTTYFIPFIFTASLCGISYNYGFCLAYGTPLDFLSLTDIIFSTLILLPIVIGGILVAIIAELFKKAPDSSPIFQSRPSIKSLVSLFVGIAGISYLLISFPMLWAH